MQNFKIPKNYTELETFLEICERWRWFRLKPLYFVGFQLTADALSKFEQHYLWIKKRFSLKHLVKTFHFSAFSYINCETPFHLSLEKGLFLGSPIQAVMSKTLSLRFPALFNQAHQFNNLHSKRCLEKERNFKWSKCQLKKNGIEL